MDVHGPTDAPALLPNPADVHAAAAILRNGADTRGSVCEAAARMVHADVANLWEPRGEWLVLTATTDPLLTPGESRIRSAATARQRPRSARAGKLHPGRHRAITT
jgi:hypothetical protein